MTSAVPPPPDLGAAFCTFLRHVRNDPRREWLYHPRDNELADFVRREFVSDLLVAAPAFAKRVRAGDLACDFGVSLKFRARSKKVDLVVGEPESPALPNTSGDQIRRATIKRPRLMLETKACMTAHRQASTRLMDELLSTIDVVRGAVPHAIAVAIVIVNVGPRFTSPLNLPGPNENDERAIRRLLDRVVRDIGDQSGPNGYDAVSIVAVDFDNENRIAPVEQTGFVPVRFSYSTMLAAVGRALASRLKTERPTSRR